MLNKKLLLVDGATKVETKLLNLVQIGLATSMRQSAITLCPCVAEFIPIYAQADRDETDPTTQLWLRTSGEN